MFGCSGDLIALIGLIVALGPISIPKLAVVGAIAAIVSVWRYQQEKWWNRAPVHLGLLNDQWHRVWKQPRLYAPLAVMILVTVYRNGHLAAIPWAAALMVLGYVVWRKSKMVFRAPWK